MSNLVELKKVSALKGYSFIIPDFQRGYKWTKRQVFDLLDDLKEFLQDGNNSNSFYCLQPLVVKKEKEDRWLVIDGQQRLTTLFLLQCYLGCQDIYNIEYLTRSDSADYLDYFRNYISYKAKIGVLKDKNVDYFHMYKAYSSMDEWFNSNKKDVCRQTMLSTIKDKTQFIWYNCNEENVVEVFTRINIGKIGLTSAELIKAVMLNQSNWTDRGAVEAEQYHIAEEWNQMEITLQNDEFWYFICNKTDRYSTRIELLFDMICELYLLYPPEKQKQNPQEPKPNDFKDIGDDQYRTFRYFYNFFKENGKVTAREKAWNEVRKLFQVLNEWYKDVECYHYIGYLIECKPKGVNISKLYEKWRNSNNKEQYKKDLKEKIREVIESCNKNSKEVDCVLDQQYEIDDNAPKKTICRPILLLHNIQLVIKQNKKDEKDAFQENVFYRFPFYLLKSQNWDVEHIDSNTTNNLADNYARLLWLLQYEKEKWLPVIIKGELNGLLQDIKKHLNGKRSDEQKNDSEPSTDDAYQEMDEESEEGYENEMEGPEKTEAELLESRKHEDQDNTRAEEEDIRTKMKTFSFEQDINGVKTNRFDDLVSKIEDAYENEVKANRYRLNREKKNQIWNFTLLDSKTNRSYGNSIFPRKRRTIVARDQGKEYVLRFDNDIFSFKLENSNKSAFIPPVTRNVFMKYYTDSASDFSAWTLNDAEKYKEDMKAMLEEFLNDPSK